MKNIAFKAFVLSMALVAVGASTAKAQTASPKVEFDEKRQPIPFKAIKSEDIVNPKTGKSARPSDTIEIVVSPTFKFQGLASEIAAALSDIEKNLNERGESLRHDGKIDYVELAKNRDLLGEQFISQLHLRATNIAGKVKKAVENCELLEVEEVRATLRSRIGGVSKEEKVVLPDGLELTLEQFIANVNEQQKFVCAIGYKMFDKGGALAGDFFANILGSRKSLMGELGISEFHPNFNFSLPAMPEGVNVAIKKIGEWVNGINIPLPQKLGEIAGGFQMPEEFKIPDLPLTAAPEMPQRPKLKIIKTKTWPYEAGNPEYVSVYAKKHYELRGSEEEQYFQAYAKAGFFVFKNDLCVAYAGAYYEVGPQKVAAKAEVQVLGETLLNPSASHEKHVEYKDVPFKHEWSKVYSQQFMVGPVPVVVEAIPRAGLEFGYSYGLYVTKINGNVYAKADSSLDVRAGVGVSGIFSVGAGGHIVLLAATLPVDGEIGLKFTETGTPFLRATVDANFKYTLLNGSLYAYAAFWNPLYVNEPPGCSRDGWEIRCTAGSYGREERWQKDLVSWPGESGERKVFSWGIEYDPYHVRYLGSERDLSDDQMADNVSLRKRQDDLQIAKKNVHERAQAIFGEIHTDLSADTVRMIPGYVQAYSKALKEIDTQAQDWAKQLSEERL